jgi:VanZ family protein
LLGAATLAVALFWGGGQPFAVGLFPAPFDKLAHSVYFATLAVLLWFGTGGRWPVLVFLVVSAIGGLDELHQNTLPGRVADFYDYLIDTVAAGLAIMLLEKNKAALAALQHRKRMA